MRIKRLSVLCGIIVFTASVHTAGAIAQSSPFQVTVKLFDNVGAAAATVRKLEQTGKQSKLEQEGATSQVQTFAPLPTSNGSVQIAPPASSPAQVVSPSSLRNTVAQQTPAERDAIAHAIAAEIQQLEGQLNQRLAISPRTPDLMKEINAINNALSAKRQAYEFAQGTSDTVSLAAAESYAAVSNPYFLMCGDHYWAPSDPLKWYDQIKVVSSKLAAIGRSVGVISAGDRPAGTSTVVAPNIILTNKHVLEQVASFDDVAKQWRLKDGVKVTFDKEYTLGPGSGCVNPNAQHSYFINGVFKIPENSDDLALLITSSDSKFPESIGFTSRPDIDYAGNMTVAIIGYPGAPDDMTIAEQIQFFQTPTTNTPQFGYKRLSEGFTGNQPVTSAGMFVHKANTAGGDSGSPVIDLSSAVVVGIHVQGHNRFMNDFGYNEGLIGRHVVDFLRSAGL